MTPAERKDELRRELRARWKNLPAAAKTMGSELICERLPEHEFWKRAGVVLLFVPLPDEVNIRPLITLALAANKIVALPRFDSFSNAYEAAQVVDLARDIAPGAFGVDEPRAACAEIIPEKIDLALIPGAGFDLRGNRLGRGKGYYDRLLAEFAGIKCGVALDEQVVREIPAEKHDVRMDRVFTPARVIIPVPPV